MARSYCASARASSGGSPSPGWRRLIMVSPLFQNCSPLTSTSTIIVNQTRFFSSGEPDIKSVQPFTKVDLIQIPFVEILRNFQILEAGNIPVNPLVYLYPNTPKDEAFAKYYSNESGGTMIFLWTCVIHISMHQCVCGWGNNWHARVFQIRVLTSRTSKPS